MNDMREHTMQQLLFIVGAILAIAVNPGHASAQDYPNRTVRIVVPYAPGGGVSLLAQTVGNKMSELMKQPVIVDNRPGAGGNLGADVVAKSTPDGYTLLLHTSAMSSASSLYSKLPFDPVKDFAPVSMVIATQFVIGGSPKNSATNLRELIAVAKEKPGAYNFGSSGPGSSLHLFAELFNNIAGIKLVHVPYRGDTQMVTALIADDIQVAFLPQANGIGSVQGNLIRGLGVTGTKRMGALPNVPTALEDGGSLERDPEKEPQRRYGVIDTRCADAARGHMQLKAPYILECRRIRRTAKESGQVLNGADVALLGSRR